MLSIIRRWFFIWSVITKYRLDLALPTIAKKRWVSILVKLSPSVKEADTEGNEFTRIRKALEDLGPIFVKFGQTLSTRPDLLHPDLAMELSKLQDKVKSFPPDESIAVIEDAFKSPINEIFASFEDDILASASIAQVHAATLHSGDSVVVKVVRPGIAAVINRDLSSMLLLAKIIDFLVSDFKRLRLPELVEEFAETIHNELDLRQEAANASKLRANFPDSDMIYIPEVYWELVSQNVMVMERIYATSISDMESLRENDVDMEKLAARGVEIFFIQVFYHKYFHADMHPGNIFVDISNPNAPQYRAIDFGIMGTLSDEDQYYLAENFLAFFNRDYYRVAKLHIDSGWVPSHVKLSELEAAVRKVGEPIFGKPLDEISFGDFLITLVQVARKFDMIIQPQLLLLQKTVLNVEGLARVLYPKLDLWATAKPILEQWMKDNFGPKAFLRQFRSNAVNYRDAIPKIPQIIEQQAALNHAAQKKQKPLASSVVILATSVVIFVLPQLWYEDITRPFAGLVALVSGFTVFKNRNK